MPTPGKQWRHVTLGTHNAWLPGDPRGFRARHHRLHSSGDHRNPPPPAEHADILRRSRSLAGPPQVIPPARRGVVGGRLRDHLIDKLGHRALALACAALHTHMLVELPSDYHEALRDIGRAKQAAALVARSQVEGKLWGKGSGVKPVTDPDHHRRVYAYILRHAEEGAWVWSYREGVVFDPAA